MNVNCMNCGAMLIGGETVCPVCQQPVAPAQGGSNWQQARPNAVTPWQQPVGRPHYGPPPGAGSGNTGLNAIWLVLIGLALLVILGAGGVLVYLKNRDAAIRANNDAIDEAVANDPSLVAPDENSAPPSTPTSRTPNNPRAPISGGVLNGKAISLPKPTYPAIARAARASGTVIVKVTVDESGKVIEARAVSGHPLLQASAVAAARQARFSPTKLSGKPVKVTGTLSYNFTLE